MQSLISKLPERDGICSEINIDGRLNNEYRAYNILTTSALKNPSPIPSTRNLKTPANH